MDLSSLGSQSVLAIAGVGVVLLVALGITLIFRWVSEKGTVTHNIIEHFVNITMNFPSFFFTSFSSLLCDFVFWQQSNLASRSRYNDKNSRMFHIINSSSYENTAVECHMLITNAVDVFPFQVFFFSNQVHIHVARALLIQLGIRCLSKMKLPQKRNFQCCAMIFF